MKLNDPAGARTQDLRIKSRCMGGLTRLLTPALPLRERAFRVKPCHQKTPKRYTNRYTTTERWLGYSDHVIARLIGHVLVGNSHGDAKELGAFH